MPAEPEEIPNQVQEKRLIDSNRKGTESFISNPSGEPDRNSFPSYSNRGRDENGAASSFNDRERYDLKSSQTAYTGKAQVQNSANTQEEEKATKVSPPRRKAYREDKSDRQSNYAKKDNGPETGRAGYKKQPQQQQRPPSASASSRQSEKESSCDDVEIDAILEVNNNS